MLLSVDNTLPMEQQNPGFVFCQSGLKYSLKCWLRESKLKADEVIEQAAEEDELNREVDALFRYIFGMPQDAPQVVDGVIIGAG